MKPAAQYNKLITDAQEGCKEALAGLSDGNDDIAERLEFMWIKVYSALESLRLPESREPGAWARPESREPSTAITVRENG